MPDELFSLKEPSPDELARSFAEELKAIPPYEASESAKLDALLLACKKFYGAEAGRRQAEADARARAEREARDLRVRHNRARLAAGVLAAALAVILLWVQPGRVNSAYQEGYAAGSSRVTVPAATYSTTTRSSSSSDSYTVYVSRNGVIHKSPTCSGMKYYTEMTYSEAVEKGYRQCSRCY